MRLNLYTVAFFSTVAILSWSHLMYSHSVCSLLLRAASGTLIPVIMITSITTALTRIAPAPRPLISVMRLIPTYPILIIAVVIANSFPALWLMGLSLLLWLEQEQTMPTGKLLGCVDISSHPDQRADKVKKACK